MASGLAVLCFLLLHTGALGFGILPGKSLSHLEITEEAILNTTVNVCHAVAQSEQIDFTPPSQPFTAESVSLACGSSQSTKSFRQAINVIKLRNLRVDLRHALNASFHFDDEMFVEGRKIITEGLAAVKANTMQENYETAREKLGQTLHPLQDFYSHSNWVELGKKFPNSNLIKSDTSIGNLADESKATCRNCDGDDCTNNILEDIISDVVLTSGYFSIVPGATKPTGKCSHGGAVDLTSKLEPKGGINKDSLNASHGHLHTQAANMAAAATTELLEDIRGAAGDRAFLQMLGISRGSSKALCFVIDTTNSMSEDIATVKSVTFTIINSNVETQNKPAAFILVPFNDPVFGPLIKTTDSEVFKRVISSLSASGGGDEAEPSLSGLQLALSGAPFNSEIFLFTDAPAKDPQLKTAVIALIERTQTVVNFLITDSTTVNRRRRRDNHRRISASDAQLYRDLARASGGQAIEVTKTELPVAVDIIINSVSSSLVTLLQASRNPGRDDTFSFIVDDTVTNLIVYITGLFSEFTLTNPAGEFQHSSDTGGPLITSSQTVGNFRTLRLKKHTGLWEMKMVSTNSYNLRVIGQSPIDFLFDFVEASQGPFSGFDALDTRPRAGLNGSLLVTLTGSATATVTEVDLVESSGSEVRGAVESQGSGTFLVQVTKMPSVEFVVRVKGQDNNYSSSASPLIFQRQTPTSFRSSNLTITANANSILSPGTPFIVPFSVMTSGPGGNYTIRATNSRQFPSTSPTSFILETGKSANGTVTLSAPITIPSGSDVTLTIEAEAPGGADTNYIVLRLSIINTVTDFVPPVCQRLSFQSNCSKNCSLSSWKVILRVTDGASGTGVDRVTLRQGGGNLTTSPAAGNANITLATYISPCCSTDVELEVVDRIGNKGTCFFTIRNGVPGSLSASTRVSHSPFLCLSMVVLGLYILTELGFQ